jgi:S1-C subfamily serine protease
MTDENQDFENTSPFGESPFAPTPPPTPPAFAPEPVTAESKAPSALRRAAPIAAFGVMLVLAAGAAGVVGGHEVWSSSKPQAVAPPVSNGGTVTPGNGSGTFNPGNFNPGSSSTGNGSGSTGGGSTGTGNGNAGTFPGGGFFGGGTGSGSGTSNTSGGPSDLSGIASKVSPALVDINVEFGYQGGAGAGTGIVLSSNGEVLTNNHVVEGATKITATDIGNGKTYDATVVGYDPSHDVAVIQLQNASGLTTAKLGDSSKLSVGQQVVGIGNAGGTGGQPSAAGGQITGLNQSVQASDDNGSVENLTGMIGINAAIQPGDSGGPLVDTNGDVIGMDTAGSQGFSFSFNGNSASNSAFAIPINTATETALRIVTNHPTSTIHVGATAFLGVTVGSSGSGGIDIPGVGNFGGGGSSATSGVPIASVLSGQAAEKAGLAAGDTITSLNGTTVNTQSDLSHALLGHHPGDIVKIGYVNLSGSSQSVSVKLGSGPAA